MPDISTSITSRLHYKRMGAGPVLVLIHGFPEDSNLWRNVWRELSKQCTLLIPDMPGSGGSLLEGETTLPMMAQAVKEMLEHEDVTEAVVAGHSMGGYIALAFARAHVEAVKGLALIHSTPLADDEEKKANRIKSAELIRKGGKEAFVKQMVPNLFIDSFKQNNPLAVKEQVEEAMQTPPESLINYCDAMRQRADSRDVVHNAAFPVQWVMGEGDSIMNYKRILAEAYRSAINFVSFYQDCGHMSMIEAPERLAADLATFAAYCHNTHSQPND